MVVAGILALALALPTGALFGIGYGTGVRIGYEQIYPLLFPANTKGERNVSTTVNNVKQINSIYNAIGGKEASQMGIATGIASAMGDLDKNPDFQDLLQLESILSGNTSGSSRVRTRFGLDNISQSADNFSDAQLLVEQERLEREDLSKSLLEDDTEIQRTLAAAENEKKRLAAEREKKRLAANKKITDAKKADVQALISKTTSSGTINRKVISFTYPVPQVVGRSSRGVTYTKVSTPRIKVPIAKQTYVFGIVGHVRKYKSIASASHGKTKSSVINTQIKIAYIQALTKAFTQSELRKAGL